MKIDIIRSGYLTALCFFLMSGCVSAREICMEQPLRATLESRFPGWKLVMVDDLRVDDAKIWREGGNSDCPGIAEGKFGPSGENSYAISLFSEAAPFKQLLLVATRRGPEYNLKMLSSPKEVDVLSVVLKAPPGRYTNVDGKSFSTVRDGIVYETIESGSLMFVYRNKDFEIELMGE